MNKAENINKALESLANALREVMRAFDVETEEEAIRFFKADLVPHIDWERVMAKGCPDCSWKGYLIVRAYGSAYLPDGLLRVERCDSCQSLACDGEAANKAFSDGVAVETVYPYAVRED